MLPMNGVQKVLVVDSGERSAGGAVSAQLAEMGPLVDELKKSGVLLWSRQIYVIVRNPRLEDDVQNVFITKLTEDGNALLIHNERNYEYRLDLKTLEVYPLKGSIRIETRP